MEEVSPASAKTAADGIQNQIDFSTKYRHYIHRQRLFALECRPFQPFFWLPTIVIDDLFLSNSSLAFFFWLNAITFFEQFLNQAQYYPCRTAPPQGTPTRRSFHAPTLSWYYTFTRECNRITSTTFSIDDGISYQSNMPPATRNLNALCVLTGTPEKSPNGIEDEAQPVFEPLHVGYPHVGSSEGFVVVLGRKKGQVRWFVGINYSVLPLENFLLRTHRLMTFLLVPLSRFRFIASSTPSGTQRSGQGKLFSAPRPFSFVSPSSMVEVDMSCIGPPMPAHIHRASFPLAMFSLTVPWN